MSRMILVVALLSSLAACSFKPSHPTNEPKPYETNEAAPPPAAPEATKSSSSSDATARAKSEVSFPKREDEMNVTLKKNDGKMLVGEKTPESTKGEAAHKKPIFTSTGADTPRTPGTVSADKALLWLQHGNTRFVKGSLRKDGQSKKDVARVADQATPHAIIFGDSNSQVPPELIFDEKLGEVDVVRSWGTSVGPGELASLEHGIARLGVNLLVVLGQTRSDAVKLALSGKDAGSPYMSAIIAAMRLRLNALANKPVSKDLHDEAWANVNGVASEIVERSEILKKAVASGTLKIVPAVYDVATGKVEFK